MGTQLSSSSVVSGALSFALRMSRYTGIAPLNITKLRSNHRIRVSRGFSIYGNLLAITLCFLALIDLISDLYLDPEESIRTGSRASQAIYFADLIVLALVVLTAASTSAKRMDNMITYLNHIRKINLELSSYCDRPYISSEKGKWISLVLLLFSGCTTFVLDWIVFTLTSLHIRDEVITFSMHVFFVLLFIIRLMAQIQFAMIAMTVLATFKQLNACLKDLLRDIQLEEKSDNKALLILIRNGVKINNFTMPAKSARNFVDTMMISPKTYEGGEKRLPKASHEVLHGLSRLYWSICDVVRQVDRSHGPLLLLLVFSYFMHLLVSLYSILTAALKHVEHLRLNSIIQLLWLFYHLCGLIVVIEPCHHTQEEMATTKHLVSKMAQNFSNNEAFNMVLDLFINQLILTEVVYAPLKMCTLNRTLVVSILGSITTYLVVVIQF